MPLTAATANIFVFGDLVLDHFIPVTDKQGPYQPVGSERVFDGHRRRTVAGGASNCARAIAALGPGRVCLWGLSGYSPWGSFPRILQQSLVADRPVIFLGSHNESQQMNTITRVVKIDRDDARRREFRFDDIHMVPATDTQRGDALAYLREEAKTHRVDAIIINDLDMGSLSTELITAVGEFAANHAIPLFVDPKRDWKKYREIPVTCVLPNLSEWCHLVGDPPGEQHFRNVIKEGRSLEAMAVRSLRFMPNAKFHIVKCDRHGAIVIYPSGPGRHSVRHILPYEPMADSVAGQLGAGDVFAGALAVAYAGGVGEVDQAARMHNAIGIANRVVACYLRLDWQRIPTESDLERLDITEVAVKREDEVTDSVLLLPDDRHVDLASISVAGSGLVSVDAEYKTVIHDLVAYLSVGWEGQNPGSAILTGRGGLGKTELTDVLRRSLEGIGIEVWTKLDCAQKSCPDVEAVTAKIAEHREQGNAVNGSAGLLVVIDEAFSKAGHLLLGDKGKMLLQAFAGDDPPVRFLFVDADFSRYKDQISASQMLSRCREFELPSLATRHRDIPYILAASCLSVLRRENPKTTGVRISEGVLLSVINWVLSTKENEQSPRKIATMAVEIVRNVRAQPEGRVAIPEIRQRHLPRAFFPTASDPGGTAAHFFFSWSPAESAKSGS